jgi:hypothetical protein
MKKCEKVKAFVMHKDMGFILAPEHDFHPGFGTVVMAYRLQL